MAVRPLPVARRLPVDPLGILGLLVLIALWWAASYLQLASPLFLPAPGGVVRTIADNFFSSPYLANYHLGDGGLLASLVYTVSNVWIALAIAVRRRDHARPRDRSRRPAARHPRSHRAHRRDYPDPGDRAVLPDLVWHQPHRANRPAGPLCHHDRVPVRPARRRQPRPGLRRRQPDARREPRRVLLDVYLVGTLPEVFGGIRIALAGAWGLEAFSELLGAPHGIGQGDPGDGFGNGYGDDGGGNSRAGDRRSGLRRDCGRGLRVHHQMAASGTPLTDGRQQDGTGTAAECRAVFPPLRWRRSSRRCQT